MGIFERWRRVRADVSSESLGFEALTAEMTAQGCLIITREGVEYTVYWARSQDDPLILRTSVEAIKRVQRVWEVFDLPTQATAFS